MNGISVADRTSRSDGGNAGDGASQDVVEPARDYCWGNVRVDRDATHVEY